MDQVPYFYTSYKTYLATKRYYFLRDEDLVEVTYSFPNVETLQQKIMPYKDVKVLLNDPKYKSITLKIINPSTNSPVLGDTNQAALYDGKNIPMNLLLNSEIHSVRPFVDLSVPGDIRLKGKIIKFFTNDELKNLQDNKLTKKQSEDLLKLPENIPNLPQSKKQKFALEIGLDPPFIDVDDKIGRPEFLEPIYYLYYSNGTPETTVRYYFLPSDFSVYLTYSSGETLIISMEEYTNLIEQGKEIISVEFYDVNNNVYYSKDDINRVAPINIDDLAKIITKEKIKGDYMECPKFMGFQKLD